MQNKNHKAIVKGIKKWDGISSAVKLANHYRNSRLTLLFF